MLRLEGKVAIVTGGGGPGIGGGISTVLAKEGAQVVILEIDQEAAEKVRREIEVSGGKTTVVPADISHSADVQRAVDQVIRDYKHLDILVNNAGVGLIRSVAEATEEEFDRLASIDLRGLWLCCKYAIPHMQRQKNGSIINIASVHAGPTEPFFALYAAMKAGVLGLTRGTAVQYGADGIRANAVCPGLVDCRQTRNIMAQLTDDVDGWIENFLRRHQAIPYAIQPSDVGNLVAFLASDDAKMITGATIPVDAGMWAQLTSRD